MKKKESVIEVEAFALDVYFNCVGLIIFLITQHKVKKTHSVIRVLE